MAFLDNSGDIILDAVLTDVGRKRMAKGNFRISVVLFHHELVLQCVHGTTIQK